MTVMETKLEGVLILQPRVFEDERGRFLETWNAERYAALGIEGKFVKDNVSFSKRGVLRGLMDEMLPILSIMKSERSRENAF